MNVYINVMETFILNNPKGYIKPQLFSTYSFIYAS